MALKTELLEKYPAPSLEQAFALAKQVSETQRNRVPHEDRHKLEDLVKHQKEFLRDAHAKLTHER